MKGREARPYLELAAQLRPASARLMYARLVADAADAGVCPRRYADPVLGRWLGISSRTVARNRGLLVDAELITAEEHTPGDWRYRVLPLRAEAVVDAEEPQLEFR